MANNDWDLDDLLEFKFDREVPEKSKKSTLIMTESSMKSSGEKARAAVLPLLMCLNL